MALDAARTIERLRQHVAAGLLVLFVVAAAHPTNAVAQSVDPEQIVSKLGLQTELPKTEKKKPSSRQSVRIALPGWVPYLLIGLFGVLIAAMIARELNRRGLAGSFRSAKTPQKVDIEKVRDAHALGNIDAYIAALLRELATTTDFAAGVHRMLLEAIAIIKPSLNFHLSDAFTSRELIRKLDLIPSREEQLALIIRCVEHSHFGGLAITRQDFDRCFDAFSALVAPAKTGSHG